jgi:hypothetical protein
MIGYKLAEKAPNSDEYFPVYYRDLIAYTMNDTSISFEGKGFHAYSSLDKAEEELSNIVHDNIQSLRSVGCDIESIADFAKAYVILECEFPDETTIVDGEIIIGKVIKLNKQL